MDKQKELLLKDLCARLPHGVYVRVEESKPLPNHEHITEGIIGGYINGLCQDYTMEDITEVLDSDGIVQLYLRPLSSITEEEVDYDLEDTTTLKGLNAEVEYDPDTNRIRTAEYITQNDIRFGEHTNEYPPIDHHDMYQTIDWLNAHHFDYRGLISKGLALEAPEGMYN